MDSRSTTLSMGCYTIQVPRDGSQLTVQDSGLVVSLRNFTGDFRIVSHCASKATGDRANIEPETLRATEQQSPQHGSPSSLGSSVLNGMDDCVLPQAQLPMQPEPLLSAGPSCPAPSQSQVVASQGIGSSSAGVLPVQTHGALSNSSASLPVTSSAGQHLISTSNLQSSVVSSQRPPVQSAQHATTAEDVLSHMQVRAAMASQNQVALTAMRLQSQPPLPAGMVGRNFGLPESRQTPPDKSRELSPGPFQSDIFNDRGLGTAGDSQNPTHSVVAPLATTLSATPPGSQLPPQQLTQQEAHNSSQAASNTFGPSPQAFYPLIPQMSMSMSQVASVGGGLGNAASTGASNTSDGRLGAKPAAVLQNQFQTDSRSLEIAPLDSFLSTSLLKAPTALAGAPPSKQAVQNVEAKGLSPNGGLSPAVTGVIATARAKTATNTNVNSKRGRSDMVGMKNDSVADFSSSSDDDKHNDDDNEGFFDEDFEAPIASTVTERVHSKGKRVRFSDEETSGMAPRLAHDPKAPWELAVRSRVENDDGLAHPSPSGRWGSTLTRVDKDRAILLGGESERHGISADAFTLVIGRGTWSPGVQEFSKVEMPQPRTWHSSTLVGQNIFVFGGEVSENKDRRQTADLLLLDTKYGVFVPFLATGSSPTARGGHCTALLPDNETLCVFGGIAGSRWVSDCYLLDTSKAVWHKSKNATKSVRPAARSYATLTRVGEYVVLFGGNDSCRSFSDVFIGTVETKKNNSKSMMWTEPLVLGKGPAPRTGHFAVAAPSGRSVIVGGGWDDLNIKREFHSDVWELVISSQTECRWKPLHSGTGTMTAPASQPGGRAGAALCEPFEDSGQASYALVFGGLRGFTYHSDVFKLKLPCS